MKTLNEMTRKELAGKWFDLQNERGMNLTNRSRFIARCLNGVGAMKAMDWNVLYNCCVNAQAALANK